ncbi:MAG: diacylglycerol/lipid kinase family protein [Phycisphaerales bacterium]
MLTTMRRDRAGGLTVGVEPPGVPWVAITANPYSGAGKNREIVGRLQRALEGHGLAVRVLWDWVERKTVLSDGRWMERCRCVVVAGGDGTVADVLNEVAGIPGVSLAVLPIGNENLFARQFGYRDAEQVAAAVARGQTMGIDVGEIVCGSETTANGERRTANLSSRLFTLMVSAGFDAEVVHRVQQWRDRGGALRRARRWSYFRPTLRAMLGYRYPLVELVADGYVVRGCHAMVFNLPQYACGLRFTPQCVANDGLLHWVVFPKRGVLALGRYLALAAMGSRHLGSTGVQWGAAREVELRGISGTGVGDMRAEARTPQLPGTGVPVQVDGDPAGFTPVRVKVRSHAARIVVT